MARPADSPPPTLVGAVAATDPRRPDRARRPPRRRLVAASFAIFVGIALVAVGIVQTTGGLAGIDLGGSSRASANAGGSGNAAPTNASSPVAAAPSAGSGASSGPIAWLGSPAPSSPPSGVVSSTPTPTEQLEARLQATLDRGRTKLAIPGASVTILFPDGSSWTGVSGLADIATGSRVRPGTAFAFASMSKTFTSALIVQLVAEGRIRLSDSAAALLPKLAKPVDRRITVAMLLDHTSGLDDYFLNPKIDRALQSNPTRAWTVNDALAYVRKPYFPPGRGWHYSNTNYLLLGLIAERVTGQPLAVAIRSRLLDPAGLGVSWYQAVEQPRAVLAHGYRLSGTKLTVRPVDVSDGSGIAPFRSVVTAAAGAGSIAGTSADLAQWARELYSGAVLGPQGTALLLSGFPATAAYLPTVPYGYGVQAVVIDGHPSYGHSGRLLGFRGVVRHFPVDGLTIAILTNQNRADPAIIVRALLKVALTPVPCPICEVSR